MLELLAEDVKQHHQAFAFNVDLYSVGIPLALLLFTPVVRVLMRTDASMQDWPRSYFKDWPYLAGAAFAWFWAIQLPNVPVSDETESTVMHFMGGAIIGPLLFAYVVKAYQWPARPPKMWMRFGVLFAFVCGVFGTGNELLEFFGTKFGGLKVGLTDTSWDIAENFAGMVATFIFMEIFKGWPIDGRRQPNNIYANITNNAL